MAFLDYINLIGKGQKAKRATFFVGVEMDSKILWLGKDTLDASLTFAYNEKKETTIWGEISEETSTAPMEIEFAPFVLRGEGTAPDAETTIPDLQKKLIKGYLEDNMALMTYPIILAFAFSGTEGEYSAIRYSDGRVFPQSLGGSGADGVLALPIKVSPAGTKTYGTVDKIPPKDEIGEFTEEV